MAVEQRLLLGCDRCTRVSEAFSSHGVVYLWFPLGHTMGKVVSALNEQGIPCDVDRGAGYIGVNLDQSSPELLVRSIEPTLTSREMQDSRALHMPNGGEPKLADVGRTLALGEFIELSRADLLRGILLEERLTSHFQPIVSVANPAEIYAHEALLRGVDTDGTLISPGVLFQQARDGGLLFQLDLAARRSAILNAVKHDIASRLFVNFSPAAIYDPVYCLRTTVSAVREGNLDRDRVVFEVIESDKTDDPEHLVSILEHYRAAGFRVALDDVGAGYGSLNMLHRLRPDYMKLDMDLIRNVDSDSYKSMIAGKLLEMANELRVTSVVEGVETQGELDWARQHGADYAQGYFFARPAPEPRTSLE
ncbi:MAG: EAL domain-containing protein [Thermomicrobiaceae bacterium]